MSERWTLVLSDAQAEYLRQWGVAEHLESQSEVLRAALRRFLPDMPGDVDAHGGERGTRPKIDDVVRVKRATHSLENIEWGYIARPIRPGSQGRVVATRRQGVVVALRDTNYYPNDFLRYRDLEIVQAASAGADAGEGEE